MHQPTRILGASLALLLLAGCGNHSGPEPAVAPDAAIVDLTHTLTEDSPVWPGATRFQRRQLVGYEQGYLKYEYTLDEGIGTHMDAPVHFVQGARAIDALPVERFIAPAVVVDVSDEAASDPDYQLSVQDLRAWEKAHGRIPEGAFVILRSGWAERWPDEERYRNTDAEGVMHFPGFAPAAAEFLASERAVAGIGTDTLSLDYGPSERFRVHFTMFEHGRYQVENLANLDALPATGATIVALPAKFGGAPEAPARVIALLPEDG